MDNSFFPEIKGRLGFGYMRLPLHEDGTVDKEKTCEMADLFIDAGFNYFDTAHGYTKGQCETSFGECVAARHPREDFVLAAKLTDAYFKKTEDIRPFFMQQLRDMQVDYFDFYLMHSQSDKVYKYFQDRHAYEEAYRLKEEGYIRHFGISFHDKAEMLEKILTEHPEIELVQIQLNYLDFDDLSVESGKVYEVCERFGKAVSVMEPVKGGILQTLVPGAQQIFDELNAEKGTHMSNASYALRFAAGFKNVCIVLSGMGDMDMMRDNTSFMKDFEPLGEEELAAVWKVRDAIWSKKMVPCTGCRYCVEGCPKNILIPDMFSCYNTKKTFGDWNADFYYGEALTSKGHAKASECLKCGKCEAACPQHLPIRDLLKDVAEEFEKQEK